MVTDEAYGRAQPDLEETGPASTRCVRPLAEAGRVPGARRLHRHHPRRASPPPSAAAGPTGRPRSSAPLLPAEEIQIWTDVDGMMTVDPRVVPRARVIPEVSFDEAAELAYFGAKVLHPATIKPAVEQGIPVRILNSMNPTAPGTLIGRNRGRSGEPRAIAFKKGISVVLITQPRMLMAYGFLARVFEVFDRHRTPVDLIATSEVSVSLTVDDSRSARGRGQATSPTLGEVKVLRDMAIVSVVGRGFVQPSRPRRPHLPGPARHQHGHDLLRRLGRERLLRGGRSRRGAGGAHAAPRVLRHGRRRVKVAVVGYGKMGHEVEAVLRERGHEPA